ncbi:MAG: hypothetical protein V7K88_00720 [Nostoc sp.]|uniref:hypothetical protein n=1 Tax=Nostoc sp. TaxID=1180 RepID=UPI002FF8B8B1
MEILQAIAVFNDPQRRRENRVRRGRSLFLTNHRGAEDTEEEKSDGTVEILQVIAYHNFTTISNIGCSIN